MVSLRNGFLYLSLTSIKYTENFTNISCHRVNLQIGLYDWEKQFMKVTSVCYFLLVGVSAVLICWHHEILGTEMQLETQYVEEKVIFLSSST